MPYIDNVTFLGTNYKFIENETFRHICDINLTGDASIKKSLSFVDSDGKTINYWKTLYFEYKATFTTSNPSPTVATYIYLQHTPNGATTNVGSVVRIALIPNNNTSKTSGTYYWKAFETFTKISDGKCLADGWTTYYYPTVADIYESSPRNGAYTTYTNGGCCDLYLSGMSAWTTGTISVYGIPA